MRCFGCLLMLLLVVGCGERPPANDVAAGDEVAVLVAWYEALPVPQTSIQEKQAHYDLVDQARAVQKHEAPVARELAIDFARTRLQHLDKRHGALQRSIDKQPGKKSLLMPRLQTIDDERTFLTERLAALRVARTDVQR